MTGRASPRLTIFHQTAIATAVTLSLGVATAGAEETSDAESRLLERVSITGGPDRVQNVPGSAQILDREAMDRHSSANPNTILAPIPGVNTMEEGGFGLFPHISMRGVNPERNAKITVMEDGVLVAPAPYAASAAYYFPPMGRMDSVEVIKGSGAVRHGPHTVGGALNMQSTPIPEERSGKVHHFIGNNNARKTHMHIGDTAGQWGWLVESFTNQSDGFKKLDNALSGPNQPKPETGFDRDNLMAKLRWESAEDSALYQQVEFKYARDNRRINDTYLGLTEDDFNDDPFRRYAGSALDEINTENEKVMLRHYMQPAASTDVTTTLYRTDTVRNWFKLHEVNGTGISDILADPETYANEADWMRGESGLTGELRANNREYYAQGAQMTLGHWFEAAGWFHDIEAGVRVHEDEEDRLQWHDEFSMNNGMLSYEGRKGVPGDKTNRLTEAQATALFVQNTMESGPWQVVAGLRQEDVTLTRRDWQDGSSRSSDNLDEDRPREGTYQELMPGVGATYRLDTHWSLLGGYHRGFSPGGASPDGKAELSDNIEAGFRFQGANSRAEVIAFHNDYSNLNVSCTNVSGCTEEDEVSAAGEVTIHGLEALYLHDLGAARDLGWGLPVSLSYTYTGSRIGTDDGAGDLPNQWAYAREGDRLPEIPEHQLNASLGAVFDHWQTHLNANYVSEVDAFADPDRDETIDARLLFDLSAEYTLVDGVRAFGSVENLTDEVYQAHHRPAGVRPGAPRTLWAGLKVDF